MPSLAFVAGDRYFAAVSYTGGKATDAATFDEQQAVVGRASYLLVDSPEVHWLIDANGTDVFKLADRAPRLQSDAAQPFQRTRTGLRNQQDRQHRHLQRRRHHRMGRGDCCQLEEPVCPGGLFRLPDPAPPEHPVRPQLQWLVRVGDLEPDRRGAASLRPHHRQLPRPAGPPRPLGDPNGLGAWELAARFSNINLNDDPFLASAAGGVSGGNQTVWTLGVNWYPTDIIRFALNYDNIKVSHPNATANNITADAIVLACTQLTL